MDRTAVAKVALPIAVLVATFLLLTGSASAILVQSATSGPEPEVVGTVVPAFDVAHYEIVDVDGDGTAEVLVIGSDGEVRTWRFDAKRKAFDEKPRGSLVLENPDHVVVAVGDVLGVGKGTQLVVLSPDGATAYPFGDDGAVASEGVRLARRARLELRLGRPRRAEILQDVNGDGLLDLIVPTERTTDLWMNESQGQGSSDEVAGSNGGGEASAENDGGASDEDGKPAIRFRRAAQILVDVDRERETAVSALSDRISCTFMIPKLRIEDLNRDGRSDLRVDLGKDRAFHMQREDGAIPSTPDVELDLRIFKDTTPKASVELGETVAGSDDTNFYAQDLNGDDIPDYVIAHRRKVWVFHGSEEGPQFTRPSSILKVAEDISALLVERLNDDEYPDLVLFKIRAPGVTTLLRGLVSEWDLSMTLVSYPGTGGRSFAREPDRRSELVIRLPSILSVLRDPAAILQRLEDAAGKFRDSEQGDFDGKTGDDVALVSEDFERIEVWFARGNESGDRAETEVGRVLRDVFFESESRVWDLDRILSLIASFGDQRTAALTGDRDPDAATVLRPQSDYLRSSLAHGDVDGDGRAELVVTYVRLDDDAAVLDFVSLR